MDTLYISSALKICNNSLRRNILSKLRRIKENKKKKLRRQARSDCTGSHAEGLLRSLISPDLLSVKIQKQSKYKIETHELSKAALAKVRPKQQQKAAEHLIKQNLTDFP